MTNFTEHDVMLSISKWMHIYNVPVWWNHKNDTYPTFKTTSRKRSDMLMLYNNKYYIIECKKSDKNRYVYDAFFQILEYAKNETDYFINGNKIKVSGFVIGTDQSINGKLFINDNIEYLFNEGHNIAINNGEIPRQEYALTKAICRLLWRGIPKYNITCSLGILVSNVLNKSGTEPLLLMKQNKQQYMVVIK